MSNDWSCAADFLDHIEVDHDGCCKWADVANAQRHIRMALRAAHSQEIDRLTKQLDTLRTHNDDLVKLSHLETAANAEMRKQLGNARSALTHIKQLSDNFINAEGYTTADAICDLQVIRIVIKNLAVTDENKP